MIGLRAGSEPHRIIGIWAVVVEKRVQTRSERLKDLGRAKSRATTTELVPKNT
jgi:hypothetical protein